MSNKLNYGERLRDIRTDRGFTQEEIAFRADITPSYYGQIERGTANPTISILNKICEVMGIRITDIFTESNTNLFNIDQTSTQILYFLSDKTTEEKATALALIKTAFRLQKPDKPDNPGSSYQHRPIHKKPHGEDTDT